MMQKILKTLLVLSTITILVTGCDNWDKKPVKNTPPQENQMNSDNQSNTNP